METVGEYVQEAVDFMNSGAYLRAVAPTAQAIEERWKKLWKKMRPPKMITKDS